MTRLIGRTGHALDLSQPRHRWAQIAEARELLDVVDHMYSIGTYACVRRLDEMTPAGTRLHILASGLISYLDECLHAVQTLLGSGAVYPRYSLAMLRPWYESAARVAWLLLADEYEERVRRSLRLAWSDHLSHFGWLDAYAGMGALSSTGLEQMKVAKEAAEANYWCDAEAIGIQDWEKARKQKLNLLDFLTTLDGSPVGPHYAATWKLLSAVEHGQSNAANVATTALQKIPISGGEQRVVTLNEDIYYITHETVCLLTLTAIRRYVELSTPANFTYRLRTPLTPYTPR